LATIKKLIILISIIILYCSKDNNSYKFAQYLREEQALRKRLARSPELKDSIQALQKRYQIDREKELKKLKKQPELWLKLLKGLRIEK